MKGEYVISSFIFVSYGEVVPWQWELQSRERKHFCQEPM